MSATRHLGEALHDLLDGRVHWAARAEAEAHVAGCAACARELAALRGVKEAARRAAPAPVPAELAARISAALDGESPHSPPPRWLSRKLAVALGIFVLVVLVAAAAWMLGLQGP